MFKSYLLFKKFVDYVIKSKNNSFVYFSPKPQKLVTYNFVIVCNHLLLFFPPSWKITSWYVPLTLVHFHPLSLLVIHFDHWKQKLSLSMECFQYLVFYFNNIISNGKLYILYLPNYLINNQQFNKNQNKIY